MIHNNKTIKIRKNENKNKNKNKNKKTIKNQNNLKKYKIISYNVLARSNTHLNKYNENNENPNLVYQDENIGQTMKRYNKIIKEIKKYKPDIGLLQEVDSTFITYLLKHLTEYDRHPKFIKNDTSDKNISLIIWNKSKFILDENKNLDTEIHKNKKHLDINLIKQHFTCLKLKEKHNIKETLSIANVHLKYNTPNFNKINNINKNVINYVLDELKTHNSKYKIFGGDLNCEINNKFIYNIPKSCSEWIINKLKKNNFLKIEQIIPNQKNMNKHNKVIIDSIFYNNNLIPIKTSYNEKHFKDITKIYSIPVYIKNNDSDILNGSDHAWILIEFEKHLK